MIAAPRLGARLEAIEPPLPRSDGEVENGRIDRAVWSGLDLHRLSLHRLRLTRPDLIATDLRQAAMVDVVVERGILSGLIAVEMLWRRVVMVGCRLDGVIIYSAQLHDVSFEMTRLDQANFRSASLRRVDFNGCSLRDVDFSGTSMTDVRFIDCDLSGADFSNSRLKRVDLRRATFEYLNGFNGLKGATLTFQQVLQLAPSLARQAGITIAELD